MGIKGEHTCTKSVHDYNYRDELDYVNIGVGCWDKKDKNGKKYQEGKNPFCGKKGLCCRYNQIKKKENGCDPQDDGKGIGIEGKYYHHCVDPNRPGMGPWKVCPPSGCRGG